MKKKQVVETIRKTKIIPVIRTRSADKARTIIEALVKGGIDVLEVTMTVPGAIRLIAELANQYKDAAIIGAGTVLDKDTAQKCIEAGAEFIVSPILNLETVSFCNQNEITVMAGALTPTEIYTANKAGADLVKVFPVSAMGGDSYIKAVKTVFPHVEMIPTGGVKLENAVDYIEAGALAVGMGGELTNEKESIITNRARNLLNQIKQKYQ
jgi:2-dehydro-3-deoxyphosphogluconate aldolase/(4S)-4-hydroxy-2-oxoglutarate aldolase